MAGKKVIAGRERLERELIHLASFHPHGRLLISLAITRSLDALVEVICSSIRININDLHGEIGILRVRRDIECHIERSAHFGSLLNCSVVYTRMSLRASIPR